MYESRRGEFAVKSFSGDCIRRAIRWRNLLSLYVVQAIYSLAPLVVIPYLTRVIGPSGYGTLAFFQSLIAYGIIVLNFGFYVSAVRDGARLRENPNLLGEKIKRVVAAKILLLGFIAGAMTLAVYLSASIFYHRALFFACGLQLLGNIVLPTWLFQAVEQAQKMLIPQTIAKVVTTLLVIIFVRSVNNLVLAALFLSASDVLCGVLLWKDVSKIANFNGRIPRLREVLEELRADFPLFKISIGSILYTAFNPLLIEVFWGPAAVAYYAVSMRIATAATKVTGPMIQAVSPRLSVLVINDRRRAVSLLMKSGGALAALGILIGAVFFFGSREILSLVAGGKFVGAVPVLRAFAPLAFLMVMGSLFGQNFAVYIGLANSIARVYWALGLLTAVLMVPAVYAFGAVGSAVLVVTSESLVVATILFFIYRIEPLWPRRANDVR